MLIQVVAGSALPQSASRVGLLLEQCSNEILCALADTVCKIVPPAPFCFTNPAGGANKKQTASAIYFLFPSLLGWRCSNKLLRPKGGTGESPKGFPREPPLGGASMSLWFDAQKRASAFGGAILGQQFCTLTQKFLIFKGFWCF